MGVYLTQAENSFGWGRHMAEVYFQGKLLYSTMLKEAAKQPLKDDVSFLLGDTPKNPFIKIPQNLRDFQELLKQKLEMHYTSKVHKTTAEPDSTVTVISDTEDEN